MKKLLGVLVVLIVLVGIGGGIYAYQQRDNDDATVANKVSSSPALIDSSDPVAVLSDYVPKKFSDLKVGSTTPARMAYKLDSYEFTSLVQGEGEVTGVTFSPVNPAKMASDSKKLPTSFTQDVIDALSIKGYTQTDANVDANRMLNSTTTTDYTYVADDSGNVCVLSASKTYLGASLMCSTIDKITASAQAAQPFAVILATAKNTTQDKLGIGTPKIETNANDPQYQHAVIPSSTPNDMSQTPSASDINIEGASFLYKFTADTTWTFYGVSQEGVSCSSADATAAAAFSDRCSQV